MRALAALAVIAFACGAPKPPSPDSRELPPAPSAKPDAPAIDPVLARMARARELEALRPVRRVSVDRAEWIATLEAHVAREIPRDEIENEEAFLKALGALPLDVDYERGVYDSIRGSGGGMYEPFDRTIYLPDDLRPGELERTLEHESVHALQDQHFDLRAFERYLPGATDTMLARSCLAEGDASVASGERFSPSAATYIERELAAPYVYGSAFVSALRTRGGWAEVDRAWTRSATLTTHAILHPEKWPSAPAAEVPAPTFATLGGSFRVANVDVKGELSLLLVLQSIGSSARVEAPAAGWAGDRAVLARDGKRTALAWRIRFEDDLTASRTAALFGPCDDRRLSPIAAFRAARDVLVLAGPAGARCDLLARWSKEVLP
jgi:hypothetical protein